MMMRNHLALELQLRALSQKSMYLVGCLQADNLKRTI